jgi:type I restriction enzyme S subunit
MSRSAGRSEDWGMAPNLPHGWRLAAVADGLETIIDYRGKTPPKSETGIPLISAANVKGGRVDLSKASFISPEDYALWTTRGFTRPGDVLITTEAPAGEVAPYPKEGVFQISRRVMALRANGTSLHAGFLTYALQSGPVQAALLARNRGTTVPRVLKPDITGLKLRLPPLDEQRRIAGVLGALDDKIELNRKMNRTLEEMAQALFKSWFVDFDGVPESELVDSELGPIPRGWGIATLRDQLTLDRGLSYKGKYLSDGGVPMVNLKCVRPHGGFRRGATKPYSGEFKDRHIVQPGDMVIANTDLTQARDILGCPAFVPRPRHFGDDYVPPHLRGAVPT